jgi:hypothetical protein
MLDGIEREPTHIPCRRIAEPVSGIAVTVFVRGQGDQGRHRRENIGFQKENASFFA